jgi:hypothetical protein
MVSVNVVLTSVNGYGLGAVGRKQRLLLGEDGFFSFSFWRFVMRWLLGLLAVVAIVELASNSASATVVYPTNDGFEDPDRGTSPSGWECGIPGWTKTGAGVGGIFVNDMYNPGSAPWGMTGATNGNQSNDHTSTAGQAAWFSNVTVVGTDTGALSIPTAGDWRVEFSIEGQPSSDSGAQGINVHLIDSASTDHNLGTFFASAWGAFESEATGYVTLPSGAARLEFRAERNNSTPVFFDNVQLSNTPEPGTIVLLATGLFSLLAYAWRKRKCVPS